MIRINISKLLTILLLLSVVFALSCSSNQQPVTLNYGQQYTPYYQIIFDLSSCIQGTYYYYELAAIQGTTLSKCITNNPIVYSYVCNSATKNQQFKISAQCNISQSFNNDNTLYYQSNGTIAYSGGISNCSRGWSVSWTTETEVNWGLIVGIAAGVIALGIAGICLFRCYRRRKQSLYTQMTN